MNETNTTAGTSRPLVSLALATFWLAGMGAWANVAPYALCTDGMVLQQQADARLWGTADPGEAVTVTFRGKQATATAGTNGSWWITIPSGEAGGPFEMTLSGKNTITYKNVLVGEVWLCSGQSNMDWGLNSCDNTLIQPLLDCRLRGVIWYQGEDNGGDWNYRFLLPALIEDWRSGFQNPDLAFHVVQLPPGHDWIWVLEAQNLTALQGRNTGLAVITDCGGSIHPNPKRPAGERLALAARGLTYGEKIVYSGPMLKSVTYDGARAVLEFNHVGGGGGFLTGLLKLSKGVYTITVGVGGKGHGREGGKTKGSDSVIARGGADVMRAYGGGAGGSDAPGGSGGCGGGGSHGAAKGSGMAGPPRQGYDGGVAGADAGGAGGGGAGGVGPNTSA